MFLTGELGTEMKEKEINGIGTNEYQNLEAATDHVIERIAAEPAYRIILYKILEYCFFIRPSNDVERTILSFPEMKEAMHSPQLLLSWLENAGGIHQLATEKGEGMWCTTPAGRIALEHSHNSLEWLLAQEPIYHDIYLKVLQACLSPKSRTEIESLLKGNPILEALKIYPSFFINKLEEARGLGWDGVWKTTSIGKDFLNEQDKFHT